MSHVDEGALHAYLDGALDEYPAAEARRVREHVETCAVCADRLAEARKVREEASAILDLAAPRVEVPTFEELRAYVRASQAGRTRVSVRLYRVSWAASVVLALGTGWMLRGGELVPVTPLERSDGDVGAEVQERPAQEAKQATAPVPIEEREVDAPAAAPAPEPEALQSARDVAADGVAGGAGGDVLNRAEPSGGPPAQARAAPTDAPQVGAARAAADPSVDARQLDAAGAGGGFADAARANAGQRPAGDDLAAARIDSAARAIEVDRRVTQDRLATSAITVAPTAPTALRARANEAVQTEDDDSVSLVVPGLEVLDVLPVGQGTTFAGMRALQRLENGDTLEVVHLPQGIDPALLPVRPFGHNELVQQRGAGWLVLRAPVSEAYLQELLRRLEAGR